MRARSVGVLWIVMCAAFACSPARQEERARYGTATCNSATHAVLEARRDEYRAAIDRARVWLDRLDVDPLELRAHGLKGKKKLTEQLSAYYRLWQIAGPVERPRILERTRAIVAVTYEPRYHDLANLTDLEFKQDATSYLRAAYLMERMGLDTTLYRQQIAAIHPRLNAHMRRRGPSQRLTFRWYYRHFGLAEPFPLDAAMARGLIARRRDPEAMSLLQAYELTHEVFVPYEYGDRLDARPFGEDARSYLREALTRLMTRYLERADADIVAELVSCLRYLRFVEIPAYRDGLAFLLDHQLADGAWGDMARAERSFGAYAMQGEILHTTLVAIDALSIAFHPPWNGADLYPDCTR